MLTVAFSIMVRLGVLIRSRRDNVLQKNSFENSELPTAVNGPHGVFIVKWNEHST
jgi:hypothetical protein